ncbi:S8 family serine peptidase [Embleya sp. AB8]|uniref:S8 family serine peptidase n=1 Tax=Embleya sp. AB8 TaxID=3156304 RepID=UPI003C751294
MIVAAPATAVAGRGSGGPSSPPAIGPAAAVASPDRIHRPISLVGGDWIGIAAPGEDISAACRGATSYCISTGSSYATALTSGVAALLWSMHPDGNGLVWTITILATTSVVALGIVVQRRARPAAHT